MFLVFSRFPNFFKASTHKQSDIVMIWIQDRFRLDFSVQCQASSRNSADLQWFRKFLSWSFLIVKIRETVTSQMYGQMTNVALPKHDELLNLSLTHTHTPFLPSGAKIDSESTTTTDKINIPVYFWRSVSRSLEVWKSCTSRKNLNKEHLLSIQPRPDHPDFGVRGYFGASSSTSDRLHL